MLIVSITLKHYELHYCMELLSTRPIAEIAALNIILDEYHLLFVYRTLSNNTEKHIVVILLCRFKQKSCV